MRTNRMHHRQVIFSPLGHPVKAVLAPHEKWKYLVRYDFVLMHELDLEPGLSGEVENIRRPISGWTADWKNLTHNHEVKNRSGPWVRFVGRVLFEGLGDLLEGC